MAAANEHYRAAARRWEEIIVGDVNDMDLTRYASMPPLPMAGEHSCAYPAVIDDLYVCVFDGYIDGGPEEHSTTTTTTTSVNTLAVAGTYLVRRNFPKQAFVGYVKFDTDDVVPLLERGLLGAVVRRELGHALGVGGLWDCPSVALENSPNANREFQELSGCSFNVKTTDDDDAGSCRQ